MLRLILFTMAALSLIVAPAAVVQADVMIHVEDFKDSQGGPDFDPLFNHEFSADPGETIVWGFHNSNTPGEYILSLGRGTLDVITFNLPFMTTIVYASVDLDGGFHSGSSISVRFVGSESSWEIGPANYGQGYVEITSSEIGAIQQIELYHHEDNPNSAAFRGVTIGVVPEPSSGCLLFILIGSALLLRILARRQKRCQEPF